MNSIERRNFILDRQITNEGVQELQKLDHETKLALAHMDLPLRGIWIGEHMQMNSAMLELQIIVSRFPRHPRDFWLDKGDA